MLPEGVMGGGVWSTLVVRDDGSTAARAAGLGVVEASDLEPATVISWLRSTLISCPGNTLSKSTAGFSACVRKQAQPACQFSRSKNKTK